MRLGMFMMPVHPPDRALWSTLAEDTEKSLLADQLGFDELWMGEHFSASTEPIPSPLMFFAPLAPTKHLNFGTAVINLPNSSSRDRRRGSAQFDHMSRAVSCSASGQAGSSPTSSCSRWPIMPRGAASSSKRSTYRAIWSQDPPSISRAVLDRPDLGRDRARARRRLHAEAVTSGRVRRSISISTPLGSSQHRGGTRLGHDLRQHRADLRGRLALGGLQRGLRAEGGAAHGDDWRVARNVMVAPSDRKRATACSATTARTAISTPTSARAQSRRLLPIIKPRPEMSDEETTPEAMIQECVIYGAPKTVLDKLVALRERVGPFGTLLMTGLDWGGPNETWEREAMRLLAQEVMPNFRQHVTAQAAE